MAIVAFSAILVVVAVEVAATAVVKIRVVIAGADGLVDSLSDGTVDEVALKHSQDILENPDKHWVQSPSVSQYMQPVL